MAYFPNTPPADPAQLPGFLAAELQRLAEALSGPQEAVRLAELAAAPKKPREGDVVRADGVNWNPGAGRGAYEYKAGAWSKL